MKIIDRFLPWPLMMQANESTAPVTMECFFSPLAVESFEPCMTSWDEDRGSTAFDKTRVATRSGSVYVLDMHIRDFIARMEWFYNKDSNGGANPPG